MLYRTLTSILIVLISSCSSEGKKETVVTDATEEIKVIKHAFEPLLDSLSFKKTPTDSLVVLLNDTLIHFISPPFQFHQQLVNNKFNPGNLDSAYTTLAYQLSEITSSRKFDTHQITKSGTYKIKPFSTLKDAYYPPEIGTIQFSRVAFNKPKDKACFYFKFFNAPDFGSSSLLFLEKVELRWKIVAIRTLTVS
ncbi:MAG: hypothetical protein LPJ89_04495 [Hymenobacteraceae bacterium]|nr:hypothetical protein [Hymenobacteraceae bacterium]MDX5397237.1 hypothetical protein [Hymenobacteraceae bacterium]MDX5443025.1 hypothetical protein [Hymenobacteraceae bacterium]MDX5513313.1 hypothetical protein [Hymenobacteraceae bacterium]